ncbi:MAG TPA: nitrile hydratase subunit beta [Roseiarcus sp.]|nr:nitrile hydratase subunit beta [Roseiarcus sp.]
MNGGHDLGGMMGFGALAPERDEPVFHTDWERRACAVTVAAGACGLWSLDESRSVRENQPPGQYLAKTYYDVWITALEKLVVAHGMVSAEELASGRPLAMPQPPPRQVTPARIAEGIAKGTRYDRPPAAAAAFAVGAPVRARIINPAGHTRLPRYARGRQGEVTAVRGAFVFPDANAHARGENPQWLYTVRFSARELWGPEGDAHSTVTIDAFEPYLEPA